MSGCYGDGLSKCIWVPFLRTVTLTKKGLATLDGEIVDPEMTVKFEMRDALKIYDAET